MSLSSGARIGHYEVLAPIGAGGMGEVYKARDLKLGRVVAVKVLPQKMASDYQRLRRFEQEARAASALNHPNIVTIYEIGEYRGAPYIAMEYVEGKTLRELLASGPLGNEKLCRYAAQMAEGLGKAHQAGIVHRDLKPENVIINDGDYVKLLDFGIAKLLIPEDANHPETPTLTRYQTAQGQILGTPGYMAPEQAVGHVVDARSDVFSFGVLLYEMATGRRPFQGGTPLAIFGAMQAAPAPPSKLNPELSPAWDGIVMRALDKEPDGRFDSASAMLKDLLLSREALSTTGDTGEPTPTTWRHSIVVLPFQDLSPDGDNEYFSDGLTDEIITDLSQLPELRVISRGSAMALKGSHKTPRELARELDVDHILQGSVRKAGSRLRIGVHLADTETDTQLWAAKYDGSLDEAFEIQETVSRAILEALMLKWSPDQEKRLVERRISDVQAFEYYERARQETWRNTKESLERAIDLLGRGLEIVGNNDVLFAAMGTAYVQFINMGISSDGWYLQKGEEYAEKARALNPSSSHLHTLKGFLHFKKGHIQDAIRELKRGLAIEPNHAEALVILAYLYGFSGKAFAARPILERLLVIDPLTPLNRAVQGLVEMLDGRFDDAVPPFQKAEELAPGNPFFRFLHAVALGHCDRGAESVARLALIREETPDEFFAGLASFLEHSMVGEETQALDTVSPDVLDKVRWDEQYSFWLSVGHTLLKRKDEAFDWLSNAVERGWICYPYLSRHAPFLEPLREDPRFATLMKDVKHRWERLEV